VSGLPSDTSPGARKNAPNPADLPEQRRRIFFAKFCKIFVDKQKFPLYHHLYDGMYDNKIIGICKEGEIYDIKGEGPCRY
jgi:hypothetical protein